MSFAPPCRLPAPVSQSRTKNTQLPGPPGCVLEFLQDVLRCLVPSFSDGPRQRVGGWGPFGALGSKAPTFVQLKAGGSPDPVDGSGGGGSMAQVRSRFFGGGKLGSLVKVPILQAGERSTSSPD